MVKALVRTAALVIRRVKVPLFEAVGAGAVVVGLAQWEPAAAWVAAGVALLGKSLEWDLRRGDGE